MDVIPIVVSAGVSFVVSVVGFFINSRITLAQTQRAERLKRINAQLSDLYGPLYSLRKAEEAAYTQFRLKYRAQKHYFNELNDAPTLTEKTIWRLWMKTVFLPINDQIYSIILSKSDLLIEKEWPQSFIDLAAHIASYRPILDRWERAEKDGATDQLSIEEHYSLVRFPKEELDKYITDSFNYLKYKQLQLLKEQKPKN